MIEFVIPPPQRASLPVSTGAQLTLSRQGDSQTSTCACEAATGSTRKAPADRQRHDSGRLARSFTVGGPVEGATPNGAGSPIGWQCPWRSHQWRSRRPSLPGCDSSGGPGAQRAAGDPGCRQAPASRIADRLRA